MRGSAKQKPLMGGREIFRNHTFSCVNVAGGGGAKQKPLVGGRDNFWNHTFSCRSL